MNETAEDPFTQFWAVYPRRVAKAAAKRKFTKALERDSLENILEGVKNYGDHLKENNWLSPAHPATWLHGDRWLDELETKEETIENPHPDLDKFCEIISGKFQRSQLAKGNFLKIPDITEGKQVVDTWLKGLSPRLCNWDKILIINSMIEAMHPKTVVTSFIHWENRLK